MEKKNFFERVFLFFGRDMEVSHWLKQHNGKTVEEVIARLSDEEMEEARIFFLARPSTEIKYWGLSPDVYAPVDMRARSGLAEIEKQKRLRAAQRRKAEIEAIDWPSVKKEDLELVVEDVPEHQEEMSLDWHRKGMVTIKRHYCFKLFLNHGGKKISLPDKFDVLPDFRLWNNKEFLQRHNIYVPLPSDCLKIAQKALESGVISTEMENLLQSYAYNWCINQRLAQEKAAAAEKIKEQHLKEKIRYRLKHNYGK